MILPGRVGHLDDREPDTVSALGGVCVDVSDGLGPGGGGLVVHSADHRLDNVRFIRAPYTNLWELLYTVSLLYLEHLRRLPLARQQLPDSNPAGLVCQPHLYIL